MTSSAQWPVESGRGRAPRAGRRGPKRFRQHGSSGLACDRRPDRGPFDIVGDVHGCYEELTDLLGRLGYGLAEGIARHPQGRQVVFLGDLVDRGPDTPKALHLALSTVRAGAGLCLLGNHDAKLLKALQGRSVRITHGLELSLAQLEGEPQRFRAAVATFLANLPSHYLLDGSRLVVAHAGLKEQLHGECSSRARGFALYGQTTGEIDEYGLPVRLDWAQEYRGQAIVVYGHTPVREPTWTNRTIDIDTGCVFGGALTALRYPELEMVQVPARRVYYEPARPLPATVTETLGAGTE